MFALSVSLSLSLRGEREKKSLHVCLCAMGDGDTSSAKATESGLNTLRPLSLKVCQRVHGGGRPSKSTIMAFNAFHLRREKRLRLHVLCPASQLHNVSIYGHRMPHKSAEVGEVAPASEGLKDPRREMI